MVALLSWLLDNEQFLAWGWRLAFLVSVVLIGIALYVRMGLGRLPADKQRLLKQQGSLALFHRAAFLVGQRLLKSCGKRAQLVVPRLNCGRHFRSLRKGSRRQKKPGGKGKHG